MATMKTLSDSVITVLQLLTLDFWVTEETSQNQIS